jgi:tetratricopeptide (TPR) repeat protein
MEWYTYMLRRISFGHTIGAKSHITLSKMVQQVESLGATSSAPRGLVSRRVEMYEAPIRQPKKTYHHRPQDSFAIKPPQEQPPVTLQQVAEERQENPSTETECRPCVGSNLIESGTHHFSRGEFEKALKAFNTALKTQRVTVGDDDISIALTLSNIGAVHLQQGNLAEAEKALESSLEIKRRLAPEMIMADTLNNLGNCANLRGDYEASLFYYKESWNDLRRKRGRREDIANALFNMGRLEIQQQRWESALKILSQAYHLNRDVYGANHLHVAQTLELVGFVHLQTGNFDTALVSVTAALGIFRESQGPVHADVANSLFNVGMVREVSGDLPEAWEAYSTARDIYARLLTDNEDRGYTMVRRSISIVERAIAKQTQARRVAKHHQAKELLNSAKLAPT